MSQQRQKGITILGLGPGQENMLTLEAKQWIDGLEEIYVRTRKHPVVAQLPAPLAVHSFDDLYERLDSFEQVYDHIVAEVVRLGRRPEGVTYAVPGHPFVAEATTPEIIRCAREAGIPVRVIEGLSFIEPVFLALEIDPLPRTALLDALELGARHTPPTPPSLPVMIAQIYSPMVASEVKLTLNAVYPDEHPVYLVHDAGDPEYKVEMLPLYEIDRRQEVGLRTVLYVPPLGEEGAFEEFQEVVARLRAPGGCPWDREQTHQSLKRYLLEEAYELLEALDGPEPEPIAEELGDLLLQILLHVQIAVEEGEFSMTDVVAGIHRKIVRRHPHIFGEQQVQGADGVLTVWEEIKAQERQEKGGDESPAGMLDGVPSALPALTQAQELQARAARVGFDWGDIQPVYGKVEEEMAEVRQAAGTSRAADEIGDLLFAVVNLSRWLDVDAEMALRTAGRRFRRRFRHVEERAAQAGRNLKEMSLAEMDRFWDEAKGMEDNHP